MIEQVTDDLVLPARSIDPDESIDERMTENARENIGPARYFQSEDGEVYEDWGDVFQRVAQNIAIAEAVSHGLPLSISPDELADWVDSETIAELFHDPERKRPMRELDEEIAPYCDYEKLLERAPEEIASDMEHFASAFEQAMRELRWMPNTPTLINGGTELQQLSACFVIEPTDSMVETGEDGRASIMDAAKQSASVQQSGGGVGYPFHLLRPKGARVSTTDGISSGPISFMEVFDTVCGTIKQGGVRRGAQMAIMHSQHPDVGRFCVAKRGEERFSNFNISVGITDEFVEAVKNDEQYTLVDPQTGWPNPEPFEVVPETKHFYDPKYEDAWNDQYDKPAESEFGKNVEENFWRDYQDIMAQPEVFDEFRDHIDLEVGEPMTLPARFIWQLMVDGAYNNGEPGFFAIDETNRQHTFDVGEHPEQFIHATNPCVAEGTLVNTPDGPRRVEEIDSGDEISTVLGTEPVDDVLVFEEQDVFEVTFSDGGSLLATDDHRFHVLDGKKVDDNVPLRDLNEGDTVRLEPSSYEDKGSKIEYTYQFRRGILVGDGSYTQPTIERNNRLSISFDARNEEYIDNIRAMFESAGYDVGAEDHSKSGNAMKLWLGNAKRVLDDHNLDPAPSHEKNINPTSVRTEMGAQGFLDGLLASDGNISLWTNRPQIRWTTSSEELAQSVRTIALNAGMHARIYEDSRDSRGGARADGSRIETVRPAYDIHIAGSSADTYAERSRIAEYNPSLGSLMKSLRTDYMTTGGLWKADIKSIEKTDRTTTVYDLYCSGSDTWVTEGYVNRGCAEQPLMNYEPCNLGHVNLSLMVDDGAQTYDSWVTENLSSFDEYSEDYQVVDYLDHALDTELLRETTALGTRFLDNVVTMSLFPLEEIERTAHETRKIGLGIMGFHQMLLQMGVEYGSGVSVEIAREVMRRIDEYATTESHGLALERGEFPLWEDSKWAQPDEYPEWFEQHAHADPDEWADVGGLKVRNHNQTTLAPTGTTSMLADTTGGCEPLYNIAYFKNVGDDIQGEEMLVEIDDYFKRVLDANGVDVGEALDELESLMLANEFNSVTDLETVPTEIAELFVTTEDISVEEHIAIQAAFQEHIDSGVSKTLNTASDIDIEDISDAIMLALDSGIKGATVYRIGSRQTEVKTTNTSGGGTTLADASTDELVEKLIEVGDAETLEYALSACRVSGGDDIEHANTAEDE